MLGHIVGGYYDANSFSEYANLLYVIHNLIYAFHMPLFMAISGFVYCTAYYDKDNLPKKSRIYNQVLNMICVYTLFSLVYGAVKILFSRFVTNDISAIDLALIPIKSISLYWYLYVLIFLYLIFSFDVVSTANEALVLIVVTVISIIGQFTNIPWLNISRLMYHSFFFYAGIVYKRRRDKNLKCSWAVIAGMLLLSCVLLGLFWNRAKQSDGYIDSIPVVKMIVASGISSAIWYVFENIKFFYECRFLKYLGKCSLEIYVIHGFLISGLRPILKFIGVNNVYLSTVLNLILSIMIPVVFAEVCKRMKIHDLIFRPVSRFKKKVK